MLGQKHYLAAGVPAHQFAVCGANFGERVSTGDRDAEIACRDQLYQFSNCKPAILWKCASRVANGR